MQFAHTVMLPRQTQCERSHTISRAPAVILASNLHKLVAVQPKLTPIGAKVLVHQVIAERIVPRRDRRMRCED